MKIVCLAYLHGYGGAEKAIIELSNNLESLGHDVTLVSLAEHKLLYNLDENICHIKIKDKTKGRFNKILNRALSLKDKLNEIKPDLIINFWFQSVYLCKFLKLDYKIIYSERGDPSDPEYTGLLGFIRNHYIYKIDGIVFQSAAAASYFKKEQLKNYTIIQNPVPIKFEDYPLHVCKSNIIITVGRLHPQKNHKCLIEAFCIAHQMFPNYKLHIYGTGVLERELKEYCLMLEIEDVFFKGTTQKVYDKINNSEMFVLSSDYEGMPNVLLEAMAIGKPCITTNFEPGSASEIISNGVNGYIVNKNDPVMLSAKIIELIKSDEVKMLLSEHAKKVCFTNETNCIYKKWNAFFEKIVRKSVI